MHTETIKLDRAEADRLYRNYKEHAAYSEPIDWEIQRTYDLLRKGKVIIRALESIKQAGLNREFLPKLALTPASATACHLARYQDGKIVMSPHGRWSRKTRHVLNFKENTFNFPRESFPLVTWGSNRQLRESRSDHEAQVPIIPVHLRPKRGLENYHVLWEAEWERLPPRDPYLLRRIGKADLWLVVAHWDLTEVERAALSTRV
jgi:hypothetical protein